MSQPDVSSALVARSNENSLMFQSRFSSSSSPVHVLVLVLVEKMPFVVRIFTKESNELFDGSEEEYLHRPWVRLFFIFWTKRKENRSLFRSTSIQDDDDDDDEEENGSVEGGEMFDLFGIDRRRPGETLVTLWTRFPW